ncbi:pyruvate/2-oxoglutarate dehydrogenase complex, dehydrogenase component beta subunit [Belliella baltica DSM 15883]|uniref:Pyruvate/2-oxoglutarate dehydrogenase complex, dehydrogenase component beta subunit n=1 Tax=Belliella baltica (strain DSM 15883 / CIP 108006 / LMG 21964 / BA134) TaxID=866536 RepID=I3Z0W4_BELBD|nr:dehydrogenase E1 component subunit alpha/beta [Belliella baltica]AFL82882.1 pyruvate/2-oxoglutarate dehydrogenase complex, dehydrogenase component beta subunit [Belliella baltica DSM 15883]
MNRNITASTPVIFERKGYSEETLLQLYRSLLVPRRIEEKMLILLRQGKISKWFSGWGQEAISIGAVNALEKDEFILPMHRNLGIFTGRDIPLEKLFAQFQGKKSGFTKGRDRSFHFGSREHHIVGMISHLGPQLAIADGIGLAHKLSKEEKVTLVFTGDGASSEGDFHEGLNVAAVWKLPVIFVVEHNGYGLSTPSEEQFAFQYFTEKGPGYGMETVRVDGNNVIEMYDCIKNLAEDIRKNPRPVLVEAITFRMRGHEEASGTKYVPKELMETWSLKDPVENYEKFLLNSGILSVKEKEKFNAEIKSAINEGLDIAFAEEAVKANTEEELADLFFPFKQKVIEPQSNSSSEKRFIDAISDGLSQSMEKYTNLILMGQDIGEYGGAFKITEGFKAKFGADRVRNTPLCESAIIGAGLGLSIKGYKAMVEMQFADFVSVGFNQIVNNLAKIHYRWGQNADVVVRMPTGAGVAAGPFHSQSNEAWFFHTPGLKIVYPSNPYDAKGLLNAALEDPNPYLYFEHKALYRSITAGIPDDYYTIEIGKANLAAEGNELSIITYGMGVHWAKTAVEELGIDADILDLRTLLPWDKEAVKVTVQKTGKVIFLQEDCLTGGIGGEICAWISEHCFELLDAPVLREGSLDTPIPFAPNLEKNFLPVDRFKEKLLKLKKY